MHVAAQLLGGAPTYINDLQELDSMDIDVDCIPVEIAVRACMLYCRRTRDWVLCCTNINHHVNALMRMHSRARMLPHGSPPSCQR
jgi:hypothetical protein